MNLSTLEVTEETDCHVRLANLLAKHGNLCNNPNRSDLITQAIHKREVVVTQSGALALWNPSHSSGRIPQDTYMVRDDQTERSVDWSASACNPMTPDLFDSLLSDGLDILEQKEKIYALDRSVGHDPATALGATLITDSPLRCLFADNMFCGTVASGEPFTIIALPFDELDTEKYTGKLREVDGKTVPRVLAMDFTRKIGLVYGTQYCGTIKKTLFTVMNHLLPTQGVLPLHCSANEGPEGSALFLGLSGTGKTTLSNDPNRTLIGDDEHGWNDDGVFNMEGGCYAKLINLDPAKEPDIYKAVFEKKDVLESGCIVENAMVYPDGSVDTADNRIAENSRASYPLSFLPNTKKQAVTSHPKTIFFLTADATGTLPPVARLDRAAAMYWFLMGYTSKLAGVEVGIVEPKASFSRFFGAPFMPCHPNAYADLLGKKMDEHGSDVYLINTGWCGGAYGTGQRFDILLSRACVNAGLSGELRDAEYRTDQRFKLEVPLAVSGIEPGMLDPRSLWQSGEEYDQAADALAKQFAEHFSKTYLNADLAPEVIEKCPGL